MPLSEKQKRHLRGLAHPLKPVVIVGQAGVTPSVLAEVASALDTHELVKVKVNAGDREARSVMVGQIVRETGADPVQRIGQVLVLFRRNTEKPRIALPGV
ncbi:MAG: ribosome assembly RNA-binding protein YhbY [Chromatiales bacterium]|jgi:RNA-binding protein